jgi:predicted O-linked N-acetylglucosamine transferase (SPINDLY family)
MYVEKPTKLSMRPMQTDDLLLLGARRSEQGDFQGALALCDMVLQREPERSDILAMAADLSLKAGLLDKALGYLMRCLERNRSSEEIIFLLGMVENALGRRQSAASRFVEVLALCPDHIEAMRMLADTLHDSGDAEGAETFYRRLLIETPDNAEVLINYGALLQDMHRLDEAENLLQRAVQLAPESSQAHNNLGAVFLAGGRHVEALERFDRAVECAPQLPGPRINLGDALMALKRYAEAAASFQDALELGAEDHRVSKNLGDALLETGDCAEARACYGLSRQRGHHAAAWKKALACPRVPGSLDEIHAFRDDLQGFLLHGEEHPLKVESIVSDIGTTNFYASYQGLDNVQLNKNLADAYLRACPDLAWTAPHLSAGSRPSSGDHPKIAVVSQYFGGHTTANYFNALLMGLARSGFDLHLFSGQPADIARDLEEAASQVHALPQDLPGAQRIIAEQEPDILLYPEIGMSPLSWFMAFARLAPRQFALYGHPDTSGIANIDVAFAPACMLGPGGQEHYSEELVPLPGAAAAHPPPPVLQDLPRRGSLCRGRSYLCAQSVFKIHPDFDDILLRLLQEDAGAQVFFFESPVPELTSRLDKRLKGKLGLHHRRVKWLKQVPFLDFLGMMASAHVVLDTPHFNGGSTSFLTLGMGIPVVTLPGAFMRGRQTAGMLSLIDCEEPIAHSHEDYVARAIRLAAEPAFFEQAAEAVNNARHKLFAYDEVLHAMVSALSPGHSSDARIRDAGMRDARMRGARMSLA